MSINNIKTFIYYKNIYLGSHSFYKSFTINDIVSKNKKKLDVHSPYQIRIYSNRYFRGDLTQTQLVDKSNFRFEANMVYDPLITEYNNLLSIKFSNLDGYQIYIDKIFDTKNVCHLVYDQSYGSIIDYVRCQDGKLIINLPMKHQLLNIKDNSGNIVKYVCHDHQILIEDPNLCGKMLYIEFGIPINCYNRCALF